MTNIDDTPVKKRKKSGTLTSSAEVLRLGQLKRVAGLPVQVDKNVIGQSRKVKITPAEFPLLHVDRAQYQRELKEIEVNEFIHILKSGGAMPDPVWIVQRKDGKFYIIDGQQRFEAHRRCNLEFEALLYKFDNITEEAKLFLILNRGVRLSTEIVVHAWTGPSALLLKRHAARAGSPYQGTVNFGRAEDRSRPYSSSLLLRSLCALLSPAVTRALGSMQSVLERLDMLLKEPGAEERAEAWFRLVPVVFPPTTKTFRYLPVLTLAVVARERWAERVEFPGPLITSRLVKIEWGKLVPSHAMRFMPTLKSEIAKIWR